jgi:hypothetical protein
MKIIGIRTESYGSTPSGTISISMPDHTNITLTLTEEEAHHLHAIGVSIFMARQAELAKAMANYSPPLLASPSMPEGSYSEVVPADDDDGIPF